MLANADDSIKQSVSYITWCDAIVWANAFTEWVNQKNSTNYSLFYYQAVTYAQL